MDSSTEDKHRSLAVSNKDFSVNEFIDKGRSKNTKKAAVGIIKLFNLTMKSLNHVEKNDKYKSFDELSMEELPGTLCKFLMVVSKEDGSSYNASTLNTHFQSLVRHFKMRDEDPVDISTDARFSKVREVLNARCLEAVQSGCIPGMNASECLTTDELKCLMKSEGMSRDNPRGLISLVHYLIMTGMGSRARQVKHKIKFILTLPVKYIYFR